MKSQKSVVFVKKLIRAMYGADFEDRERHGKSYNNASRKSSSHSMRMERDRQKDRQREQSGNRQRGGNRQEWDKLNQEFDSDIVRLEQSICSMEFREKAIATEWIAKLRATQRNVYEARARNQILAYILRCIPDDVFSREPFNKPPSNLSLSTIKTTMHLTYNTSCPGSHTEEEKKKYLSDLFHDSYDAGDFLSQLPVPRDGAFFVLHMRPNF